MSSPVRVDSEVRLRLNPQISERPGRQDDDEDPSDSVSENGSHNSGDADQTVNTSGVGENAIHEQISSLLKTVVQELRSIESRGRRDSDQTDRSNRAENGRSPGHRYIDQARERRVQATGENELADHHPVTTPPRMQQAYPAGKGYRNNRSETFHRSEGNLNINNFTGGGFDTNGCNGITSSQNIAGDRDYFWSSRNDRAYARLQFVRFETPYMHNYGGCPLIKMQPFNGESEWSTWVAQFEAIARRNGLSEEEMLDQLLPRLEGQAARFIFTQLPLTLLDNYRELKEEMNSRFKTIETARSFASQLSRRSQRHNEKIEEYAADLKRLYDKAHGYRSKRATDKDLVRKFLEGLLNEDLGLS